MRRSPSSTRPAWTARALAREFHAEIGALSEIRVLCVWLYKDAKVLLVDFRLAGGALRVMGFGYQNAPQGFLLSLGGRDDEDMVLDAFGYVSQTMAQGRAKG
jgi:hypothetical protein